MKKSLNKSRSAFSLLEISIIFVIVGIVLAAIIRSSSIYTDYKLNTARSLTASSDVSSIQGLILWLDATAEKSFDSAEREDNTAISTWYDINPTINPNNATQSTGASKPLYVMDAINNLPALKFDGSDDSLRLSNYGTSLTGVPETANNFTIFVVAKPNATDSLETESTTGTVGTANKKYLLFPEQGAVTYPATSAAGAGIAMGTNGITVYEHTASYVPPVLVYATTATNPTIVEVDYTDKVPSLYINGSVVRTTAQSPTSYVFPTFNIGGSSSYSSYGFYSGYIAEIIIYNRVLLNDERESVAKYLSKKWGIKLS
ncbi:MAG: hypothetical protein V4694_01040 [Pseudomonadota bacterium]